MNGWFWIRVGAILGFLGVAMGAFGAHGLKERLAETGQAANFQTAATYQMYHAIALLAVGSVALARGTSTGSTTVAGWSFLIGVIIFSGSLYILSLTGLRWLGAITPIGGLAMLVGWAALVVATFATTGTGATFEAPTPESVVAGGRR
jgi:uncharacterized membrane protein YgdD (TMEM256/DUF423 family)